MKVKMIDPCEGWRYGFPKVLPEGITNIKEWLIEQGYPEELTQFNCRFWYEEIND